MGFLEFFNRSMSFRVQGLGFHRMLRMVQGLEASKGGMKVGRIKDPLHKDSYFGITPPTFIPPFEAPERRSL